MKTVLITTANGMFGSSLAKELAGNKEISLRLMVRDRNKCKIIGDNIDIVTGDMDKPETLRSAIEGVDTIFLSSPMDEKISQRETAVVEIAEVKGVKHIIKLGGAVKHDGDNLSKLHGAVLERLERSTIGWTLISPNSVMETSFLSNKDTIKFVNALFGISGHAKIGLVALKDISKATAKVILSEGHFGKNYELTGPASISMYQIAEIFSKVLERKIKYYDLTEEQMLKLLMKYQPGMKKEEIELEILCHLKAWKKGNADLVTDTFKNITGTEPTGFEEFVKDYYDDFRKGMLSKIMIWFIQMSLKF
jgi:uncharacterized protein YbjT (DUF2867 family)